MACNQHNRIKLRSTVGFPSLPFHSIKPQYFLFGDKLVWVNAAPLYNFPMTDDTPRHTSRDMSRYSVTVHQASQLFDDAGVPRSERSIQRYCKRGHLDCYDYDREKDVIYLIDPESLERRIEELKCDFNRSTQHMH